MVISIPATNFLLFSKLVLDGILNEATESVPPETTADSAVVSTDIPATVADATDGAAKTAMIILLVVGWRVGHLGHPSVPYLAWRPAMLPVSLLRLPLVVTDSALEYQLALGRV